MAILINPWNQPDRWFQALSSGLPDEDLWLWPECPDPSQVEMLIAWRMKRTDLATFTNLQTILSMGAGVDQWLREGSPEVQLVRLADPAMADEMAAYAVHWVTHFQRGFNSRFGAGDLEGWGVSTSPTAGEFTVGFLGFGQIGKRIGSAFHDLGFPVRSWTRSGTDLDWVDSYAGVDRLAGFLGGCDAVINILPNTPDTTSMLTAERFAQFKPGAVFVNIGRGSVVDDEADLVAAIDDGPLRAAVLDVTSPEPPSADAQILSHPDIVTTPHISGMTSVDTAAELISDNIKRIRSGEEPFPTVDRTAGY